MQNKNKNLRAKIPQNIYIALKIISTAKNQRMDQTVQEAIEYYVKENRDVIKRVVSEVEGV